MTGQKPKIVVIFSLIVGLVLTCTFAAKADYWREFRTLLNTDLRSNVNKLLDDMEAYNEGIVSESRLIKKAEERKQDIFENLKEAVRLGRKAPNMTTHTKLIGTFANIYLTSQLWQQGLTKEDTKMKDVGKAINLIMNQTVLIAKELESSEIGEDTTSNAQDTKETVVVEYSGSGMKTTRPFTVDSSWELQWKASGMVFQVYLQSEDGQMVDILANQQGEGEGSSYSPKTGTYYLEINAMGDWEIKIVEVR